MREVVVYIAASLDGYITGPNESLDFLGIVEREGEDYGYHDFIAGVDTVLMGRKTYDVVQSFDVDFPHRDRECIVFSRTRNDHDGQVQFSSDDPVQVINRLRNNEGRSIFVDGGAELIQYLLHHDAVDRMIISWIPCMLGNGVRLFADEALPQRFALHNTKSFASSLVQCEYQRMGTQE